MGLNHHVEDNLIQTTLVHRTYYRVTFYLVWLKVSNKFVSKYR